MHGYSPKSSLLHISDVTLTPFGNLYVAIIKLITVLSDRLEEHRRESLQEAEQ